MSLLRSLTTAAATVGAGLAAGRFVRRRARRIDFEGRVVLITGGSRGLGLALARRFAAEGARLALVARTEDDLAEAAGELRGRGADVLPLPADVSHPEAAEGVVEAVVDHYGWLDVLVNDAGVIQVGPLEHITQADVEEAMGVHFWAPYHLTRAATEHLPEGGRVVNIASIGGLVAVPHLLPYAASKFALVGLSDGLRSELRSRGIYVTTVTPGLMRTGSHVNAVFKGRHRQEYAWFSLSNASPLLSIPAATAAAKIVRACRDGDPTLTLTLAAKVGAALARVAPDLTAEALALAARLLPAPTGPEGDARHDGWESFSDWSPSTLSKPADRAVATHNETRTYQAPSP